MRSWIVFGVGACLCLGVGCGSDGDADGEGDAGESSGGQSGEPGGGSSGSGGKGGSGGTSGTAQGGSAGTAGEDGEGGAGGADPMGCADAETLPNAVDEDMEVGPGCVHINRTRVTGGAVLTIAPGTTVEMAAAGFLAIESSALVSIGTEDDPIVFTSEANSPQAGDWQCVHVDSASSATEIRYTTFEYGGARCSATGAGYEGMLTLAGAARAVSNSTFRHSVTHGVLFRSGGAVRNFDDNSFSDNELPSIRIAAPELLALGEGLEFADADDFIEIDTTFALDSTGTWLAQPVPFRAVGKMNIHGQAEVTIAAGNVIELNGSSLEVFNANLIVAGTSDEPVVFTSTQANPLAGDWGCIYFSSVTGTPRIENAIIEYAGNGAGCGGGNNETALEVPEAAVINDSTFRDIAGVAIHTSGTCNTADWCTNTFESVDEGPIGCSGTPTACP
jgi:hypothetical protein